MSPPDEQALALGALAPVASLFGRLLVQEVDPPLLHQLRQPEMAAALAEVGITLPEDRPEAQLVEELAVEYCAAFVTPPEPIPLVESLHEQGGYESEKVRALGELAEAAGVEYSREAARGAPRDHLGCILQLWAQVVDWPEARVYLARQHMHWALPPLRRLACRGGFYAQLANALLDLLAQIDEYSGLHCG